MTIHDDPAIELSDELARNRGTGKLTETVLRTDERVLARITDGIYRLPGSALRELISNAYDADASLVTIDTDAPRFSRITVRDDGVGMSARTLANVLHHIGGSAKRTKGGIDLGIAQENNPNYSQGGRRFIGKIGIGLFSVAQLTRHFQIITKRKGENVRWVADVVLKTYSEEELAELESGESGEFESGTVQIRDIPASDTDSHGTDVVLLDLKPSAIQILQSHERWIKAQLTDEEEDERPASPPTFHIGRLDPETLDFIEDEAHLPWNSSTPGDQRMKSLSQALMEQHGLSTPNPSTKTLFDNYLSMVWDLALSAPIEYVDKHPFSYSSSDGCRFFAISNQLKSVAKEIELSDGQDIREKLKLESNCLSSKEFKVVVDGIELRRPIDYKQMPSTSNSIKTPLFFIGKYKNEFKDLDRNSSGGKLSFEAYIYWQSKVIPIEHRGVLIRVHNSSGALFDDSFMRYQISEQTRLRQIVAEIFVHEGLDAAINIDRESFNFSHPHYSIIQKWLHNALKQFATQHKAIGRQIRSELRDNQMKTDMDRIEKQVMRVWEARHSDRSTSPRPVEFVDGNQPDIFRKRREDIAAFDRTRIFPKSERKPSISQQRFEHQIAALTQILDAYGLLENLTYSEQQELLEVIVNIFAEGE